MLPNKQSKTDVFNLSVCVAYQYHAVLTHKEIVHGKKKPKKKNPLYIKTQSDYYNSLHSYDTLPYSFILKCQ